ncbi:non-ribosomal peptide synthetase [Rhodocaloribacter sp.]
MPAGLSDIPPEETNTPTKTAPLSHAQQRLWVLDRLEPGSTAYHIPLAFRLDGRLDVGALRRSVNEIIRRHEVLRTTFPLIDGEPRQVVAPALTLAVPEVDLRGGAGALEARMAAVIAEPFDPATGPMLRARLFRLDDETRVLLVVTHHIVSDGWASGVFMRELCVLYTAFAAGRPSPLAPLPIQYAEVARRQRTSEAEAEIERQMAYWRRRLSGAPTVLDLPLDRPRPREKSFRGGRRWMRLPETLVEAVSDLSRRERATVYMTLLSAFATLLHRYTGAETMLIGTPIANRRSTDVEGLIGFFVNTLVLRIDCSGDPTFRNFLRRVRDEALAAFDHQEVPFERLVEAFAPDRRRDRSPLVQVLFGWQNMPAYPLEMPGLRVTRLDVGNGGAKFDLTVLIRPEEGRMGGFWEYDADLFDPETIERMARHFETLLEAATTDPDRRLSELPLMRPEERRRILHTWNATAAEYPADEGIHTLFEAQAARTPDAVAVRDDAETLTFAELNARADRIAHGLRARGVRHGDVAGVFLPRAAETVAALLGVMKAGAAYLPLDPGYPAERLRFMLEDARPAALVTRASLEAALPPHAVPLLRLDADAGELAEAPVSDPGVAVAPGDAAYVIYTSGSTGRPKGVVGTHRGAVNRFHWMWKTYPFEPGEVCAQKTSLGFVDSVWELFGPMLRGVPLVVIPDAVARDPHRLLDALAAHGVTRLVLVPSLLRALLDAESDLAARTPRLRLWVSSGEALTPDLVERFYASHPGARLLNLYGSSEVAADVLFFDTRGRDVRDGVPLGRPIDNTTVYVLDAHGRPLPVGVTGELYVGGAGLARGYLHRPELTAERFVPDPFSEAPGARLYRTGDLGRFLPNGDIVFLGRKDFQVKVRGHRIELGEVEAALRSHPAVREAAATVREDRPGDARLVAYAAGEVRASTLRAHLRALLPAFMVPSDLVLLDALPRTPSGKVDRLALPVPGPASSGPERAYVPPRNEVERTLTELWAEVLGKARVGVEDNFFELGGHSLRAVEMLARVEERMGERLPLAAVFEAPTVGALARRLQAGVGGAGAWKHLVPIRTSGTKPPLFCVHNLGGNVLLYGALARRLGPDQPVYGVQGQGLDGRGVTFACVGEMAAAYLDEVRRLQPHGPYHLLSFCLGSRIALEMARRLRNEGEPVGLLAFIDGISPALPRPKKRISLIEAYGANLEGVREDKEALWGRLRDRMRNRYGRHRRRLFFAVGRVFLRAKRPVPRRFLFPYLMETYRGILRAYVPEPYPGRIVLFRSSRMRAFPEDLGWSVFATEGVETHDLEGPHRLLDEPYVGALAERLNVLLDRSARQRIAHLAPTPTPSH